ncbi:MAG: cyclic peptide export ABC transporter [Acidobacteria bacterium]|nr:cyclic peptide export ABC transporter [Acidobacteriota bacterium]
MRLIRLIRREIPEHLLMLAIMTVISAISLAAMLWLVNAAAKGAAGGTVSGGLLLRFILTIVLFAVSQNYVLVTASQDVEWLLHRLRIRLLDAVRRANLVTLEHIGRAALHSALTQETQTLTRTLPMLVLGAQQVMVLVFLAVYLAWLSPIACILAFSFAAMALVVRFSRMVSLGKLMQESFKAELAVFDGLTDLLRGFKEVRMSEHRADGVLRDVGAVSAEARRVNTDTKRQWGWEFALLQSLFYALVGLMVFFVPLFTTNYHEVVVQATILTLFIVGPVGTLAYVTPMVSQTEFALANIEAMTERLRTAAGDAPDESARPLDRAPSRIALRDAIFSYKGEGGVSLFKVGLLSAEFRAGEITFITGGNGSGKSTMLRLLTGLIPLDLGGLLADGEPVDAEQMQGYRDQISAIFSDYHLSRRLYGLADVESARVHGLLERLEMEDKVSVRDGAFSTVALSSGQRKRLALVVALLEDKRVIVLDEWAAGQDPHFRRVFYETLLPELKAEGKIVICVTHDDRWFGLADHVLQMDEGRFVTSREDKGRP